jgi:hypothetical protein
MQISKKKKWVQRRKQKSVVSSFGPKAQNPTRTVKKSKKTW